MELTSSPAGFTKLLAAARDSGRTVGLVPTMGALHEGHLSLMRAARRECEAVAATIFVNPLQFGPSEDFDAYPRDLAGDRSAAEAAGVDYLFAPATGEMFPDGAPATVVRVAGLSSILEGTSRPGHFDGVATVVTKLLSLAGPCRAYFGEKDFQQLALVRRLVRDLSLPAEIVGCPIVRDPDGLALSSRNRRLSPEERAAAPVLHRSLQAGRSLLEDGAVTDAGAIEAAMLAVLAGEPLVSADYAVVRDAVTLEEPAVLSGELRLLVAARLGPVRLIDNMAAHA